jgi:hypothetical protein
MNICLLVVLRRLTRRYRTSSWDLKNNKGIPNEEKTSMIFAKLLDGKSHTKQELVDLVGYVGPDNKSFRNLMACMKKMGLIEADGGVRFTDALFPQGRPE